MINKTLTGLSILDYNAATDLPSAINDTFVTKSETNLTISLSLLNSLTGISLNSGNIANHKLFIRIYNSNLTTILDEKIFDLDDTNLLSSFLYVNIKSLTDLYDNEKLFSSMTNSELRKLYKSYKIVFRVYTGTLTNQTSILNTDIVQDLNFVVNTFQSGPYDVTFEHLDLCSPSDFTTSERIAIFEKNPVIMGVESVRSFYSENCQDKMPLIVYCHGNNQSTEGFDSFLSQFASYGYFGISVNLDQGSSVVPNTYYVLNLIDHFKKNILKIKSGFFNNKIDFNKIILCGLSRGGVVIETIATRLKRKNSTFSQFNGNNLTIEYNDLKCLVSIGDINNVGVGINGIVASEYAYLDAISPTESELSYFSTDHDIPLVKICGFNDNQASTVPIAHTLFYPGFCYSNRLNYLDKYVLLSYGAHNDLIDHTTRSAEKAFSSVANQLNTNNLNLNSFRHPLNEFISTLLYFFATNIFDSNKLKKLRFITPKKQRINYLTKDDTLNSVYHLFFPKNDDILYHIDNFSGITSSLAGITGFTFNSPLPFTYDYCVDSSVYDQTVFAPVIPVNQLYLDSLKELKIAGGKHNNEFVLESTDNDTFNGVIFNSYRSLFVPIESNISFGYTFSNIITLSENNYIGLKASQVYMYGTATKNSNPANFNLTLIDKNNNSATISSKNYSNGFFEQIEIQTTLAPNQTPRFPSLSNFVFFRAGDFFMKNQSLGLTNINRMQLNFGPDHGSTFSHIAFDEFVVYKEL